MIHALEVILLPFSYDELRAIYPDSTASASPRLHPHFAQTSNTT